MIKDVKEYRKIVLHNCGVLDVVADILIVGTDINRPHKPTDTISQLMAAMDAATFQHVKELIPVKKATLLGLIRAAKNGSAIPMGVYDDEVSYDAFIEVIPVGSGLGALGFGGLYIVFLDAGTVASISSFFNTLTNSALFNLLGAPSISSNTGARDTFTFTMPLIGTNHCGVTLEEFRDELYKFYDSVKESGDSYQINIAIPDQEKFHYFSSLIN